MPPGAPTSLKFQSHRRENYHRHESHPYVGASHRFILSAAILRLKLYEEITAIPIAHLSENGY